MKTKIIVNDTISIKEALKVLDETAERGLIVSKNKKFMGVITDSDIRRALLNGFSINDNISKGLNINPTAISPSEIQNTSYIKNLFIKKRLQIIPVIDKKNNIVDYISWNSFFKNDDYHSKTSLNSISTVIMAGGKGTRLDPFTKVLPKPLIPIQDKTILEYVIEQFYKQGAKSFFLTLNYKKEMIQTYMDSITKDYALNYIHEGEFYGTAGSLSLLKDKLSDIFIVSNCDTLITADFNEIIELHKKQKALISVISTIHHHKIPYGVIDYTTSGIIKNIEEKPEQTVIINTGVYLMSREALDYIQPNEYLDMPTLIQTLIKNEKTVLTYPINNTDYTDTGQWEEYKNAVKKLS